MDMGKYVAVGVLAMIVLAAVTYESPPKDSAQVAEQTLTGSYGGAVVAHGDAAPAVEPAPVPAPEAPPVVAPQPAQTEATPPAPAPPQPAQVEEPADEVLRYTVKAGQTLSDIAADLLGEGARSRWRELYAYNKDKIPDPDRIRAGMELVFPRAKVSPSEPAPTTPSAQAAPQPLCPPVPADQRSYVVAKGDTLYSIARRELGAGGRWKEILALNGLESAESVRAGTRLALPVN